MKLAAKIFYIIGLICNVIGLIVFLIWTHMMNILTPQEFAEKYAKNIVVQDINILFNIFKFAFILCAIIEVILLIVTVIALIFTFGKKKHTAVHIITLIASILGLDIFDLVGSILSLCTKEEIENTKDISDANQINEVK